MALSATKFYVASDKLVQGTYNWASNGFKLALGAPGAPTPPVVADTTFTSGTGTGTNSEVANGNGYTSGGVALTGAAISANAGSGTLVKTSANFSNPTWTATGAISLRYFIWWNTTVGSGVAGNLHCWWDYGSTLALANTDTLDVSGSNFNTNWATIV